MEIREVLRRSPLIVQLHSMQRALIGHAYDRFYGIHTESIDSFRYRTICMDATRYEPVPYPLLERIIRIVRPNPADVFFDIGCGKGRTLALFSRCLIRKCVGIEIDPALAQVATRNANSLRGRMAPIEVRVQNATEANYDSGTIYFLFNPFGAATLSAVMERIKDSFERQPRNICIVYYNPLHLDMLFDLVQQEVYLRIEKFFPWRPLFVGWFGPTVKGARKW